MKRLLLLAVVAILATILAPWSVRAQADEARALMVPTPFPGSDFMLNPSIYSGATPIDVDLAVIPGDATRRDRFLALLGGQDLTFIDTWTFTPLAGSTAWLYIADGLATASCLAFSPDGTYAYIGLSAGNTTEVAVIDVSKIYDLLPGETLLSGFTIDYYTVSTSGNPIVSMAVVPDFNEGDTVTYLFMAVPDDNELLWTELHHGAPTTLWSAGPPSKTTALAMGADYLFALDWTLTQSVLQMYVCSHGNCSTLAGASFLFNASDGQFNALVADGLTDNYAVTAKPGASPELWMLDTHLPSAINDVTPAVGLDGVSDLALIQSQATSLTTSQDFVLALNGVNAAITPISPVVGAPAFGTPITVSATSYWWAAGSSRQDGYLYISDGANLNPISMKPWVLSATTVEKLVADPVYGYAVTDGFSVTVTATSAKNKSSFELFFDPVWDAAWTNRVAAGGTVTAAPGTPAIKTMSVDADDLVECENLITALVGDSLARKGRFGFWVTKDTVPPRQTFNLSFGDGKLVYDFKPLDLCDLDRIEVWYAEGYTVTSDGSTVNHYNDLTAPRFTKGATFTGASLQLSKIKADITGLVNGVRYYVWVVAIDKSGKANIGTWLKVLVQPTSTLTDLTDEEGGVDCSCSMVDRGRGRPDPASVALALLPLLLAAGARWSLRRRWTR